jgi:serine/threonine protein kinase
MQGGREFKTEIELLSRVHHKNLVILEGFCFEQAEQMLVYEYIPNGTVMDSLSGTSFQFFTFSSEYKFWQRLKPTLQNLSPLRQ